MNNIKDVKDFWNKRPCNIRHSDKEIGTKEYFEEVEKRRFFVEPHILEFADFPKWKDKTVLEIGCGIGTDTLMFAKNGAKITAIDISEKSVEIAKKRFEVYNLNCDFYVGDAESLSKIIPVKKYDLVYSFGVIHHSKNPENIIKEIEKYIDEKSEIRIMMYNKYSFKSIYFYLKYGYKFLFNFEKTAEYFAEAQLGCPIVHLYTKKKLKKIFKNFETDIYCDFIFKYNIKKYIEKVYKVNTIFKLMPVFMIKYLEKKAGWHYLIIGKLKENIK